MISPENKGVPKRGRRGLEDALGTTAGLDDLTDTFNTISLSPTREYSMPPLSRKTGVWGDETVKSGKSRRNSSNLIEQERFLSPDRLKRLDSDDDIPLIPDIDELNEDFIDDVADAPLFPSSRLESFNNLTSDLHKQSFTVLEDVNLGLLSKHLYSETDLKEPDTCWTWDYLFTEVSSEMRSEKETRSTSASSARLSPI